MITQDTEKKLFLLDAYALIYRSYYAFIKNPRISSKGLNTSAMFGFTNTLLDILNNEKPSHIAVVFDPPEETVRSEYFTEYKANREETPEDIKLAIPYVMKIIEGFKIPIIIYEGYEADDVIGTLARKAEQKGFTTYMMTPDKDFAQLVSDKIFMYKPGRFGNKAEVWGIPEVQKKFSVEDPNQVIDILGMWGDKVDNIPGIPGIGEKTAKKFIKKYGSVEGLLENVDELKGKQKENVENNREQALLSKKLATIITDVPVELEEEKLILEDIDKDLIREVFAELEFRTLAKRLLEEDIAATEGEGQISMFGNDDSDDDSYSKEEVVEMKTIENTKHDYKLIESKKEIDELVKKLEKASTYSFDTETSALKAMEADLVGMSFSLKAGEAFYLPLGGSKEEITEKVESFRKIFEDEKKTVVAQNLKYDLKMLRRYGFDIKNKVFDTMLAHYLINPEMKHNMDLLAETYLNYQPVSISTLIGKKGKNQKSMADLDPKEVYEYAAEDADITLQLKEKFQGEIDKNHLKDLFEKIEVPLIHVLSDMELEGVKLDTETLKNFSQELGKDIEKLEKNIHELAGEDFNIDSPKQLGPILYEKLEITKKPKKTKSGQYSTSEDVLSKLTDNHEIVSEILNYRQLKKLKSTYVDPLPLLIDKNTGRLHTNYMQTVAATGRLSSNNPNLQNIPIRTERGRSIRKSFVARDEDYFLLAADYSQVELRIIAALSGDENMQQAFLDGEDIHSATASKVFDVKPEDVDREMRSKAKAVNFGIIYGQGAFGLAQNLNIKRGEAKEIIDSYFEKYSKIKEYMNKNIEFARKQGYVETIKGRRRYLPDINSKNAVVRGFAERNAINAPIQGSAADIIKIAMIDIHREMKKSNYKSKMTMQVHDELVFDAHKDEIEELQSMIKDKMQNAVKLAVPLKVDIGKGKNWLEAH
ncbi:DNA polymerase I [Halocola ammonii]